MYQSKNIQMIAVRALALYSRITFAFAYQWHTSSVSFILQFLHAVCKNKTCAVNIVPYPYFLRKAIVF